MSRIRAFLDQLTTEELIDRLDLALHGAGLGIWDWDLRDDSVHFDRRWCEMLGLKQVETPMHLTTWSMRVHPDDMLGCQEDIKAHLEGRTERYENIHRMKHADGHWVWILDRGCISGRSEDGSPVRFTGTHLDVTERERARELKERHRVQLAQLVSELPVSVALFDAHGGTIAKSPDWPGVPVAGEPFSELRFEGGPSMADVHKALAGEAVHCDEVRVASEAGPRYKRWSCMPWEDGDEPGGSGRQRGVRVIFSDVTEEVVRRRREVHQEEGRVQSLAMFAGGVAHELNSPLQGILLESEMLLTELGTGDVPPDRVGEYVETIASTALRAGRIAKALRALSRESRSDPMSAVSVTTLWQHLEALCGSRARVANIALEFVTCDSDLYVVGREAELTHILLNLINNAIDACDGQTDARVRIRATVDSERDHVLLLCGDNGPGVAPAHRASILKPWFTTKPAGMGTGLGLAVASRLAKRNEGTLRLREGSEETTFEVRLGLPKTKAAVQSSRSEPSGGVG